MGIRIHKILGYALTDVEADTDKWEITDPRFNREGYLFDREEEAFSIDGFVEYLERRIEEMESNEERAFDLKLLMRNLTAEKGDPMRYDFHGFYDIVNYDMEFGDSSVLITVPPSCTKEWNRYDDAIDYYDPVNRSEDGGIEPNVIPINRALYPWDWYMNTKTNPPTKLDGDQHQLYIMARRMLIDGKYPVNDATYELIGVKNGEELKNNIVPIIPLELEEVLKYLKIFKDDNTIYTLRPIIYGYWG
jgi:hypothetical protein